jgi:hypothetical protein
VNECRICGQVWFPFNEIVVEGLPQAILLSLTKQTLMFVQVRFFRATAF